MLNFKKRKWIIDQLAKKAMSVSDIAKAQSVSRERPYMV